MRELPLKHLRHKNKTSALWRGAERSASLTLALAARDKVGIDVSGNRGSVITARLVSGASLGRGLISAVQRAARANKLKRKTRPNQ